MQSVTLADEITASAIPQKLRGMKQREMMLPPQGILRIPETIDRLIELDTATNKPHEVTKGEAERAKYQDTAPMPMSSKK